MARVGVGTQQGKEGIAQPDGRAGGPWERGDTAWHRVRDGPVGQDSVPRCQVPAEEEDVGGMPRVGAAPERGEAASGGRVCRGPHGGGERWRALGPSQGIGLGQFRRWPAKRPCPGRAGRVSDGRGEAALSPSGKS